MNSDGGALAFDAVINNFDFKRQADEIESRIRGIASTAERESKQMTSSFSGIEKGLAVVGGTTALTFLGKQIVDTTAKFEKFGIILRNSLGETKGNEALDMIAKFAATTPFQLDEVTDSFIRMANQGFVPTRDEMVKLGDLASSTGKGFNMLTEAILDAQTGEFERLKEFGIKASSNGDKVTFSFREQQTTVDKTNSAIRDYILSLGELNGIQGANALISQSMTGQISNLSDKFDAMFNQIGQANSGVIYSGLEIASELVENYETVGKVVLGLVGVYGAYKTAVLITNAVDVLRTEIAFQQILANVGNTGSTITLTTAEGVAAVAKSKLTAAQLALNASILANPYVAAVAAVVALSAAVYYLATRTTDAEKAQNELNSALQSETLTLDIMFSRLKNATKGTDEYRIAKQAIIDKYGQYDSMLATELDSVDGLKTAYDKLTASVIESTKSRLRDKYVTEAANDAGEDIAKQYGAIRDRLIDVLGKDAGGALFESVKASFESGGDWKKILKDSGIDSRDAFGLLGQNLNYRFDTIAKEKKELADSLREFDQIFGASVSKASESEKKVEAAIVKNREFWEKQRDGAKKALESMPNADKGNEMWNEQVRLIKEAEVALDAYNLKSDAKAEDKANDEAAKKLKEYEDAKLEAQKKASSDEIALTRSQITDKKALIDFNLKQELESIDELEKVYKKKAEAAKIANPDTQMFDAMRTVVTKSAEDKKSEINKELLSSFLKNVVSNKEKEKAINEKYDALQRALDDESRSYTDEERRIANDKIKAMRETDLQEVKISNLEQTKSFKDMVSQMESNTLKALKKKKAEIDEYIKIAESEGVDQNGEYYKGLKKDSDTITEEIADKTHQQYTQLAYELGSILSQSTDEMVQKIGSLLGQMSSTFETLGDKNASGFSKATSIVSLAITAGNYLKQIRLDSDAEAINAQKAITSGLARQITMETEINKIQSERQSVQESNIFLGKDYGKMMTNSMSDVAKYNDQLDGTMNTLMKNAVFSAEGKAKRRLFGTKTGTYEFSLANMFGNNMPTDPYGKSGSTVEGYLNSMNKGDFKSAAGALLDPLQIFGGYADSKAQQNAFGNLQKNIVATLSSMGKSVRDFAKMSSEDMLTFFSLMEKGGNVTDEGTKQLIASAKEQLELVKAAKEKMKGVISELAGSLGNSVKDILVEGFKGGFGYGVTQAKAVASEISKILENMMSSVIYQAAFGKLFTKLEEGMTASYDINGDQSWVDDLNDFYTKIPAASKQFNEGMKQAQDIAKKSGFELWSSSSASSKGLEGAIKSITSDQANIIAGQMNAIRMNQADTLMVVRIQLLHLSEIATNTRYLKSIDASLTSLTKSTNSSTQFINRLNP